MGIAVMAVPVFMWQRWSGFLKGMDAWRIWM